jgi:hypothetical protein
MTVVVNELEVVGGQPATGAGPPAGPEPPETPKPEPELLVERAVRLRRARTRRLEAT